MFRVFYIKVTKIVRTISKAFYCIFISNYLICSTSIKFDILSKAQAEKLAYEFGHSQSITILMIKILFILKISRGISIFWKEWFNKLNIFTYPLLSNFLVNILH